MQGETESPSPVVVRRQADPLLGTMPDADLGRLRGVSREAVRQWRQKEGIPKYEPPAKPPPPPPREPEPPPPADMVGAHKRPYGVPLSDEVSALLGTDTDARIAHRLGVTRSMVSKWRRDREIPPCEKPRR